MDAIEAHMSEESSVHSPVEANLGGCNDNAKHGTNGSAFNLVSEVDLVLRRVNVDHACHASVMPARS